MGDAEEAWGSVSFGHAPRRAVFTIAFVGLGVALAHAVAQDQAWVAETLRGIGEAMPGFVTERGLDPGVVALSAWGVLLLVGAIGAFLVSQRSGSAFAVLVAGVVAWFVFPYAEMPWALVWTGQEAASLEAPSRAWWLAGGLVFVGTLEVVASARGQVVASLREQGFEALPGSLAWRGTRARLVQVGLGTALVGGSVVLLYRWLQGGDAFAVPIPDLLWVPVVVGVLVGVVLWWAARRP